MKSIVLFLICAVWAAGAAAQGVEGVRRELGRADFSSPGRARIEVVVSDDAAQAIRTADMSSGPGSITAYGVRLFSDSSQDGRANAQAAMGRFAEANPGIDVNISYETPAFWVTAGHFVDRIDAVALCGRVLSLFPRAFVVPVEVSVADVIAQERVMPPTAEE